MDAFLSAFRQFADFNGRTSRKTYWTYIIITVVLSIIVRLTDTHMSHPGILSLIFLLIFILPTLSMSVRRLHDTNRKGWWVLLALIPVVGPLTLIFFKASKGDTNSNRFGPAPLY